MTRRRLLAVAAFLTALAALAANHILSIEERASPGEEMVDRDVESARARLSGSLSALERSCADTADAALRLVGDTSDVSALFAALQELPLPDGAGLFLEDANRRVLAWTGATVDDAVFLAMPRDSDGPWFVETTSSRRIAVRRTRASPRVEGVPVLAVCHRPFVIRFPLRNRGLAPTSLEDDVAREFRVGEVRVLRPDAAEGDALKSSFGGTLARLDVRPLSARSWAEAVDAAAARRQAIILAVLIVIAAIALWRSAGALVRSSGTSVPAHLVRAGIVLATRVALGSVPLFSVVDLGTLTDASRYAHSLPVDLAGSPASLAFTCAAVFLAAVSFRRAAHAARRRPGSALRTLAVAAAVALACRFALQGLVDDVVVNSTVEFFSPETVLPRAAPAGLLLALLLAGAAAVLCVDAAWTILPPRETLSLPRGLAAAGFLALVLAPLSLETPHALALAAVALPGFAAALAAMLVGGAVALRAAALPLGVALGIFAPLSARLHDATRDAVAGEAASRASRTDAAERLLASMTLTQAAESPELEEALRRRRIPPDLALNLWSQSALATRTGGSSLEIQPEPGFGERQGFSADLPPATWLPSTSNLTPGEIAPDPLPGKGLGADGRWIVGEVRVVVDGKHAANLWVILEVRPPAASLPELQVLSASRGTDARELPVLRVSRYAPDGKLIETDDPYRPLGATLEPSLRRSVAEEGKSAWLEARTPDGELEVYLRPDVEDELITGARAHSFDTGGLRLLMLRATRAALCGAIVSLVALLFTVRTWARRARLRIAQRLVISYVLVSALPLSVLGWANAQIARDRADETTRRELSEAIALLRAALQDKRDGETLADLPPRPGAVRSIRHIAYAIGHHANVFLDARLVAASDLGLFDTELLPTRLPGPVYREVILSGRPLEIVAANVGDYTFDVGYAPLRSPAAGEVIGAVSVPLLHQRRLRDQELARAMTAVLGLYLASLVAAVAVGTWLARRLTRPLSNLTEASRRVARGDLERPVPDAGPDELGEVVAAFNQMQRDLGESRARLVKAEKESAWRDMARQVAHEVKNPLTPMRLAAEHLRRAWRDKAENFGDVLERGVDLIVRQTETLQRIATAFSDFARFPNRRREPVDVGLIIDEVLDMWRGVPGLEIRRSIERPLPLLSADPDELRRVFVNLTNNAVEAFENRQGTLTAALAKRDAVLVFTLSDDGPGIPEDIKPRLFEPYLSTKTKGTGLGLAICKRAVEDLGGTIAIESRKGEGTTVTVRLPLAPSPAAAPS